jgi:hypothetical protein
MVARRPPATRTALAGTWAGTIIQVQKSIEYSVTLEIGGGEAKITYPELRCGGKLTRIGSSGDYYFFVETITRGPADDNGSLYQWIDHDGASGRQSRVGLVRSCQRRNRGRLRDSHPKICCATSGAAGGGRAIDHRNPETDAAR